MHLGNGAITPECAALTFTAAAAGLGVATYVARSEPLSRQKLALAVGLGGLVFAAQAMNVPILPASSAHLVGGVLLAWALGPSLGLWTMAIVLAVQAFLLGDGGLLPLGANILNMGVLPAGLVALARSYAPKPALATSGMATYAALAAASIPLAAALILAETALFRSTAELTGWTSFAAQMLTSHLWIGIAEAAATLSLMLVIQQLAAHRAERAWRPAVAVLAAALMLTMIVLPWSSALPDGYEAAAESSGLSSFLSDDAQALAAINSAGSVAQSWQQSIVSVVQSLIASEQTLVVAAMLLTALLVGLIATLVSPRERRAPAI